MAATVQVLIKKGFNIHAKNISVGFKRKIDLFASHFGTIKSFLRAKKEVFEKLVFVIDNPNISLTEKDYEKIKAFQESGLLDAKLSVQENFIRILSSSLNLSEHFLIFHSDESIQAKYFSISCIDSSKWNK